MSNLTNTGITLQAAVALKSKRLSASGLRDRADVTRCADHLESLRRIRAAVACEVLPSDRDDASMDILARLYAEARAETSGASCDIRRERLRMSYLRLEARSWERARAKRRDELDSEPTNLGTVDLAGNPADADMDPLSFNPEQARHGAAVLCDMLGLRTGGKIETAFYVYLRGDDIAQADVASELGMTHGAVRNAVSQAGALIAAVYPTPSALLAALGMTDRAQAGAPETASKRTRAAIKGYRRDSWRTRPDVAADVRHGHAVPTRLPMSDARKLALAYAARRAYRQTPVARAADRPLTGWRIPKNMRGKAGMSKLI